LQVSSLPAARKNAVAVDVSGRGVIVTVNMSALPAVMRIPDVR
jgi:uncharacterized protein YqfA (UPF0365 family)